MQKNLLKSAAVSLMFMAAASTASASVHCMAIQEVFVGKPSDEFAGALTPDQRAQYVMLEFTAAGQNFTNGTRLRVEDASGNLLGYFGSFTSNAPNGGTSCTYPNCRSLMIGTQAAKNLFTFNFDQIVDGQAGRVALPAAGGRVCFTNSTGTTIYDCVAWGTFNCSVSGNCVNGGANTFRTGDGQGSGGCNGQVSCTDNNFGIPAAQATGLIYGRSLTRTTFTHCNARENSTDFTIDLPTGWPNPINNSEQHNNVDSDGDGLINVLDCNDADPTIFWPAISSFTASVNQATVCLGTAQEYSASVLGGVSPHAIAWDFSYDGVTFNAEGAGTPVIHTQPSTGSYTVRARVTDSCDTQQVAFSNISVTVNAAPSANPASAAPNPVCLGSEVQFNADPTGGKSPYTYEWDFNSDFVVDSTQKNPLHIHPSEGNFNAQVKVTDANNCNTGWVAVPNNPIAVTTAEPPCGGGAPPPEVSAPGAPPLVFDADGETLLWEDASASGVVSYNLYKGDVTALNLGFGACFLSGLVNPTALDSSLPPAGEARFYLVTGEDAGGLESTLGDGSEGARINATPCP